MRQSKIKELDALLASTKDGEKRNGAIEKKQLEILSESLGEIASEYYGGNVDIDSTVLPEIKKYKNQWALNRYGEMIKAHDANVIRNPFYDSKTFDGIVPVVINGKEHTLFFILKGVQNQGGHQDNVAGEIGTYSTLINQNKDENFHFFFVLDGSYFTNEKMNMLDKSVKYNVSNSSSIKEDIVNYIQSNL